MKGETSDAEPARRRGLVVDELVLDVDVLKTAAKLLPLGPQTYEL